MTTFYICLPGGDTYFFWRQYIYIEIIQNAKVMKPVSTILASPKNNKLTGSTGQNELNSSQMKTSIPQATHGAMNINGRFPACGQARHVTAEKTNYKHIKQRTITFVIIILVFLSIFSANYELFNMIRSSEIFHSKILKSSREDTDGTKKGIYEAPGSAKAMNFIESTTMEIISTNF